MSLKKAVARNVIWNWSGLGVGVLAGVVIAPFLVHRLGHTTYGLWILIASFTSYFGLLDVGVRGAVSRQLAFFHARKDRPGYNATFNTAAAILAGGGLVALLGTLGVVWAFFWIFDVPPDQVNSVRLALLLVGLNLAIWMPLQVFDGSLWAQQRFDLINAVEIATALVRVGATYYLIGQGYGLVGLGVINLLCLAGNQALKGLIVFRIDPLLRVGRRYVTKEAARGLLGIGIWNILLMLATVINAQSGPLIIGARMSVGLVTPFSIAARMIGYGREFLIAGTGVLTPVAIALHAEKRHHEQARLFLDGGKYCLLLTLFLLTVYLLLGQAILVRWMGPTLEPYAYLLVIFALGEAVPMSQWVSYSIILGKYRHKALGIAGMVENALAILLALIFSHVWGLGGVALGFAIPGLFCRGLFQLFYASRLVGVPVRAYLNESLRPALATAALPGLGLALLVQWRPAHTWADLILYTGSYSLCYLAACGGLLWRHLAAARRLEAVAARPSQVGAG